MEGLSVRLIDEVYYRGGDRSGMNDFCSYTPFAVE